MLEEGPALDTLTGSGTAGTTLAKAIEMATEADLDIETVLA